VDYNHAGPDLNITSAPAPFSWDSFNLYPDLSFPVLACGVLPISGMMSIRWDIVTGIFIIENKKPPQKNSGNNDVQ